MLGRGDAALDDVANASQSAVKVRRGGSRKGKPNRASAAREREMAASGMTAIEFLTSVMRDENREIEIRIDAAKGVAPYIHPKLAQTQITADVSVKHEIKQELLEKIVGIIAKAKY